MTDSAGQGDLLVHGGDAPRLAGLTSWTGRHPRRTASLVLFLAIAAAVAALFYVRSGPRLPTLVSADQSPGTAADLPFGPWTAGSDGEPVGPPQLTMTARLSFGHLPAGGVQVLGMAGPGLRQSTSSVQQVAPAQPQVSLRLRATVDCSAVPLPVPPDSYRLRLRAVAGSRTTEGTVAAGQLGRRWASAADQACGSWLARRNLTVTEVSGTADPLRPRARLTLTVKNQARSPAVLLDQPPYQSGISVLRAASGPVRLPPGGTAEVPVEVRLGRCDVVPPPAATSSPGTPPLDTGALGLVATFGAVPEAVPAQSWLDGFGPSGVLFAPSAADALVGLLRRACGDVTAVVPLIAPGGVHLDLATRVVTVTLLLDMAAGKVHDLQLVSDPAVPDQSQLTPLWTRTPSLVPDYSGQAHVTLTYRVPVGGCGPASGVWLPAVTAVAHVPGPAGVRTLSYSLSVNLWENPQALDPLCPSGPD